HVVSTLQQHLQDAGGVETAAVCQDDLLLLHLCLRGRGTRIRDRTRNRARPARRQASCTSATSTGPAEDGAKGRRGSPSHTSTRKRSCAERTRKRKYPRGRRRTCR